MKQIKEDMFTPQEMREYEASKLAYQDIVNPLIRQSKKVSKKVLRRVWKKV